MKVVCRSDFLKLPAETFFCKGKPWAFEELCIKGDSLENDWMYLTPCWVSAQDSGEAVTRLYAMLAHGFSFPGEDAYGRDGCFDPNDVFLIFERDDLLALRGHIDAALALFTPPAEERK